MMTRGIPDPLHTQLKGLASESLESFQVFWSGRKTPVEDSRGEFAKSNISIPGVVLTAGHITYME